MQVPGEFSPFIEKKVVFLVCLISSLVFPNCFRKGFCVRLGQGGYEPERQFFTLYKVKMAILLKMLPIYIQLI